MENQIFNIPSKLPIYNAKLNAVGIDLGTLECCAFVVRKHGPDGVVLDEFTAQRTLPSNMNLSQLNFCYGQIAINRMDINAQFSIFDIKQLLGKTFNEIVIDPLWPFEVVDYGNQISLTCGKFDEETLIFGTSTALCSVLLKFMKQKIEEYQGTILSEAVITVPSSFSEKQKEATIEAAEIAKWKSIHLLPEPIASAVAYSYEIEIPNRSTFLLFDCGGGTTDICIAKVCDNRIKIICDNGDLFLGGKDFDKLLINYFNSVLKHMYEVNVLETNKKYRLMIKCREIKHNLSTYENDKLDVDDFKFDDYSDIPITRNEFEDMATDLILRAKNLIAESLRNAKFTSANIDTVFQVGGGCRMPMIKKMLKDMFPNAEHKCSIHPEELVAKGAALYSYSLKNETM
uniref:Heat shock protein 70 n=1 Tax=Panagrolaimus davidi TaxID=227884 RepID=A0A914QM01_9BILA